MEGLGFLGYGDVGKRKIWLGVCGEREKFAICGSTQTYCQAGNRKWEFPLADKEINCNTILS